MAQTLGEDLDLPPVVLNDLLTDGQTQPNAIVILPCRPLQSPKEVEQLSLVLWLHAFPIVHNLDSEFLTRLVIAYQDADEAPCL